VLLILILGGGLADSLSDLFLDLTYVPEPPEDGSDQEDFDFSEFRCIFSLIKGTAEEVDMVDEDVAEIEVNIGKKRPFEGPGDEPYHMLESDLKTDTAVSSAQTACKFWKGLFSNAM